MMKLILEAIKSLFRKVENKISGFEKWCVNPDWNQNDDTAPDYVKNRPFYIERKEITEVLKLGRPTFFKEFPAFNIGDKVTIKVDNVEHTLTAFDENGPAIGDSTSDLENGNLSYGFIILSNPSSGEVMGFSPLKDIVITYSKPVYRLVDRNYIHKPYHGDIISLDYVLNSQSFNSEEWENTKVLPDVFQEIIDAFETRYPSPILIYMSNPCYDAYVSKSDNGTMLTFTTKSISYIIDDSINDVTFFVNEYNMMLDNTTNEVLMRRSGSRFGKAQLT